LLGLAWAPRWRLAWMLGAFVPGALLTSEVGTMLVQFVVPIASGMGAPLPPDGVVALVTALPVAVIAIGGGAMAHEARATGWLSAVALVAALVGIAGLAACAPYTPERPKRIDVQHRDRDGHGEISFEGWDDVGMEEALTRVAQAERRSDGSFTVPAPAAGP